METKKYTGTVKFINKDWGYGMIIPDDKSLTEFMEKKDVMAHVTKLLEPVMANDKVEFEVNQFDNKIRAFNIRKLLNR